MYNGSTKETTTGPSEYASSPNHFGPIVEGGMVAGFGVALCKEAKGRIGREFVQALDKYEKLHEWEDDGCLICWRFTDPISPDDQRLKFIEGYIRLYEDKGFPFYQGLPIPMARFPVIEDTGKRIDLSDQRHRNLFDVMEQAFANEEETEGSPGTASATSSSTGAASTSKRVEWNPEFDQDGTPAAYQHGITNIINDEWERDLPMGQKFLYLALGRHCGNNKNWCIVSEETLARDIGAAVRSVRRYMNGDAKTPDDCLVGRRLVKIMPHKWKNMHRYELPEWRKINFKKLRAVTRK
jgi:hypothetical protein